MSLLLSAAEMEDYLSWLEAYISALVTKGWMVWYSNRVSYEIMAVLITWRFLIFHKQLWKITGQSMCHTHNTTPLMSQTLLSILIVAWS